MIDAVGKVHWCYADRQKGCELNRMLVRTWNLKKTSLNCESLKCEDYISVYNIVRESGVKIVNPVYSDVLLFILFYLLCIDICVGTRLWSSKLVIGSTGWVRNVMSSYTGFTAPHVFIYKCDVVKGVLHCQGVIVLTLVLLGTDSILTLTLFLMG